jgi:hypothetical protein
MGAATENDMKKGIRFLGLTILLIFVTVLMIACERDNDKGIGPGVDTYDVDRYGIPKFVGADYIELSKIQMISKFRSAAGHDYSDDFEICRSMKHYFWPFGGDPGQTHVPPWTAINIYSPVSGTISRMFEEWAGTQIQIRSNDYPAFYFSIFHVTLVKPLNIGDVVTAGQRLGNHVGEQTMSDIAVGVNTPSGWKLLSYFDVITDSEFQNYQARGISSRDTMIISQEARNSDPLTCNGETFANSGHLQDWVTLN